MKRLLLLIVFVLACSTISRAQQTGSEAPATKEDVEAYFRIAHSHEMVAKTMDVMAKSLRQMMHERYLKDKDKLPADFEERMNKRTDDLMKNMPIDEMMQAMVPAYQKHFTKSDIDALIAFYSSPVGQKVLNELPAILSESMQNMMPVMNKYLGTVRERLDQEVAEMERQAPLSHPENPSPTAN